MREGAPFDDAESKMLFQIEITKISDGLGFGEGSISAEGLRGDLGPDAFARTQHAVEAAIMSPEAVVPVDRDDSGHMLDDDGCGDGRGVGTVFGKVDDVLHTFRRSLHRPKVFGGGVTMSAAALVGLGKASGKKLNEVFSQGLNVLKDCMIDFGGHTDTHAHGANCGCGAIDRAPAVVANAVKYQEQIRATIEALGEDVTGLDEVEEQYCQYAAEIRGQEEYSGKAVMDEIVDNGKVVKRLEGSHIELAIVLNTIAKRTVNQGFIRQAAGGKADVFGVDVWRMKQLAQRMYGNPEERQRAYLSELVYTLATAATLTKGDLAVYLVQVAPKAAMAQPAYA